MVSVSTNTSMNIEQDVIDKHLIFNREIKVREIVARLNIRTCVLKEKSIPPFSIVYLSLVACQLSCCIKAIGKISLGVRSIAILCHLLVHAIIAIVSKQPSLFYSKKLQEMLLERTDQLLTADSRQKKKTHRLPPLIKSGKVPSISK